jgi:hypothetical protein
MSGEAVYARRTAQREGPKEIRGKVRCGKWRSGIRVLDRCA